MNLFKNIFILSVFLTAIPLISFSQFTLTIEINNLRNSKGQILLELNDENEKMLMGISEKIVDNKCIIVIENLKSGKYAFKYFHDENKNKKLDSNWMGIPNEGFGFSNNAKESFGPPSFKKMIFELKQTTKLKCTPAYF